MRTKSGFFERYVTGWKPLCIMAGITPRKYAPKEFKGLAKINLKPGKLSALWSSLIG